MYELQQPKPKAKGGCLAVFNTMFKVIVTVLVLICVVLIVANLLVRQNFTRLVNLDTSSISADSVVCEEAAYHAKIDLILDEWIDAFNVAAAAPRLSLASQISGLQSIRRKMNVVAPGQCMGYAHRMIVKSMDESIEGFLGFLSDEPASTVQSHFDTANKSLEIAKREMRNPGGK